jgi:hypothetical protein
VSRLTVDELLAPRLVEDEHEIEGVGTVGIRGLSRQEVIELQKLDGGIDVRERRMVSLGLVDPKVTEDDVAKWQKSSLAPEIEGLTVAIGNLSGLGQGAQKSGLSGV